MLVIALLTMFISGLVFGIFLCRRYDRVAGRIAQQAKHKITLPVCYNNRDFCSFKIDVGHCVKCKAVKSAM